MELDITKRRRLVNDLTLEILKASRPSHREVHVVSEGDQSQLFVVDGSRLYELDGATLLEMRQAMGCGSPAVAELLNDLGVEAWPTIPVPADDPPVRALSLAVAQKCNLGCAYCYAEQGGFGEPPKDMPISTSLDSVRLLLEETTSGDHVNLAFMGGEPLRNRSVLQETTLFAAAEAAQRGVTIGFSVTTNGTLLTKEDADFFEDHGFAVTVSLDGLQPEHDRLRPFVGGAGSYDLIMRRIQPLLERQRRMQVSARVTVTPFNSGLRRVLDNFVANGFHSVGFSPLLHAPNGKNEMDTPELKHMLAEMIDCGLAYEEHELRGLRYPFLNMINALEELERGTHRPYPCGAGVGYFGVSADGDLAACHRFVGNKDVGFGSVAGGVDMARRRIWLQERHVGQQLPCNQCWARYLCGGGCHHEVLARGRSACEYIRGWLHYTIQAYARLRRLQSRANVLEDPREQRFDR
ncbi:radical SAM protein [Cupriavidus sp. H18C2]|uniref:radical SAM protein n=1 Tax=Cupriavidus sp. H18C2 TaxID=3241602 RepID=UPI003BF81AF9